MNKLEMIENPKEHESYYTIEVVEDVSDTRARYIVTVAPIITPNWTGTLTGIE